jgi:hypothetical protein
MTERVLYIGAKDIYKVRKYNKTRGKGGGKGYAVEDHDGRPVGPQCRMLFVFYSFPIMSVSAKAYPWQNFVVSPMDDSQQRVWLPAVFFRVLFAVSSSRHSVCRVYLAHRKLSILIPRRKIADGVAKEGYANRPSFSFVRTTD